MWNFTRRREAPELLVAEAKARRLAEDQGLDPDETPEAQAGALVAHQQQLLAAQQMWARRVDGGGGGLQPRTVSAEWIIEPRRLHRLD